ncbi:sensor histidine kinase [Clostridium aminobutyricum]|uniref:histidine kinase n=1 Tax=Clostridium aminobutyricum TaxID=33953 RepID=A0A939IIU3_CLOAM|nr:HAMP domain-containing sensor histidine kinase [Clostridium aminobutyricum]MBN7773426.1 HAMP domain-containing protein [Clostridium aminobutyricum]
MKSLKGRFIRANILMVIISAVLVIFVSLLLLFIFSMSERDGVRILIERSGQIFEGEFNFKDSLMMYAAIWAVLICSMELFVCTILSASLSRAILEPLRQLRTAAETIADGNLSFEILSCEDKELNDLCISFDQIRQRLKRNAEQEKRIETERNMLIANLSHDMRTPITTIKGYLEGINDGVADSPEKMQKYLDTIYNKALILERLVDNMTQYSELELGRMQYAFEFVDLTAYLKDLEEDYKQSLEDGGFCLEVKLLEMPLTVVADRDKLKRVLDNLLSNAIKYNKDGGNVTISTETDGKGVLLSISDTGMGIKESDINKVFDGFYRGDAARSNIKGNGLGLAISKQIIESHRGKIWIKSEENVGTQVYIYLPLRQKE